MFCHISIFSLYGCWQLVELFVHACVTASISELFYVRSVTNCIECIFSLFCICIPIFECAIMRVKWSVLNWGKVLFKICLAMCVNGCVCSFVGIVKGYIFNTVCIGTPECPIRPSMLFMHMLWGCRIVIIQNLETGWKLQFAIIHNREQSFVLVLYVTTTCM